MTDELKQWEYDKGYTKGYSDGRTSLIKELEQIIAEIYDIPNWVKPQMIKNDMVKLINKHISELKGSD